MLNRMNHRCSFFFLLLVCADIGSSANISRAQEYSAPVALRGTDVGKFTATPTSDPQVVVTSDAAVGEVTSIGSFTLRAAEHINLQTLEISQAHFTITAANGDRLMGTYKGTGHVTGIPNVIEYDVAGSYRVSWQRRPGTRHLQGRNYRAPCRGKIASDESWTFDALTRNDYHVESVQRR
jgi:hypothetical protein